MKTDFFLKELLTDSEKKELMRIQASIPKTYLGKLMIKAKDTKEVKAFINTLKKAIKDESNTPEQRKKAQIILDSGILESDKEVADERIEKKIDAFINKQFERSIRLKRLPSKEELNRRKNKKKK